MPQTLQRALAHHRAGRLTEAEQLCRAIPVTTPLFDTDRFKRRCEAACTAMRERQRRGEHAR